MNRDDALARFHRARRAYQAATAIYERAQSSPYPPADPAAQIAEYTASKTALAAATQTYDDAIIELQQHAHDESTAAQAKAHWHRIAQEYTANQSQTNYQRLNAAHAAYTRAAAAAGLRPTEE